MDFSAHPTIVEYAVRECFKHKSPKAAAASTKRRLAGSPNLLVGGGAEIVEIDEQQLENQIWLRMAARTIQAFENSNPEFKSRPNSEEWVAGGILQEFSQKITPKNVQQLEEAVRYLRAQRQ